MKNLFDYPEVCDIAFDWDSHNIIDAVIREHIKDQSQSRKILIPACGTGRFSQIFSDFAEVHAFDLNKNTIQFAKKKRSSLTNNIYYYVDDMCNLNLLSNKVCYDSILILNNSIQYLPDRNQLKIFLNKLRPCLKDQGKIMFEMGMNWKGEGLGTPYSWHSTRGREEVKVNWTATDFSQNQSQEQVEVTYKNNTTDQEIHFKCLINQTIWSFDEFEEDITSSGLIIDKMFLFPDLSTPVTRTEMSKLGRYFILVKKP